VDFPEFLNMMAKKINSTDSEEEIREAFRVFDRQKTGHISGHELTSHWGQTEVTRGWQRGQTGHISGHELRFVLSNINTQLTEEEIEQLIKDIDSDHDGLISYEGK